MWGNAIKGWKLRKCPKCGSENINVYEYHTIRYEHNQDSEGLSSYWKLDFLGQSTPMLELKCRCCKHVWRKKGSVTAQAKKQIREDAEEIQENLRNAIR